MLWELFATEAVVN